MQITGLIESSQESSQIRAMWGPALLFFFCGDTVMISCKFCNSSIQYSLLFQPAQIAYKLLQEMHSYSQKQWHHFNGSACRQCDGLLCQLTSSIKITTRTSGYDKYSWIFANIFMTSFPLYTQQCHTTHAGSISLTTPHFKSYWQMRDKVGKWFFMNDLGMLNSFLPFAKLNIAFYGEND